MLLVSRASYLALLPAILVAASCGRIGFDSLSASGTEQDASLGEQDATPGQRDATLADASFGELDAAPLSLMDPPSLAGMWSIDSVTYANEGAPVLVPRAGPAGTGVVGEFELTSTGSTTFAFKASTMVIDRNLPVDYQITNGSMAIQVDELWLVTTSDGDTFVASASLVEGQLALDWVESDPRNNIVSITPPLASVLRRNYSFAASIAGDWDSESIEYRNGDIFTPTACVQQSGTEWQRLNMDMQMDSLNRWTVTVNSALYSNASCTSQTSSDTEVFFGMGEEDGTQLELWGGEPSFGPVYFDSQLSVEGANVRIAVTDCRPKPSCESLSEVIVFAPVP